MPTMKSLTSLIKNNPLDLNLVAFIFLLIGLASLVDILITLYKHPFTVHPGILGIPVCYGLLKHRQGWKSCALFFVWIEMIASAGGLLGFLVALVVEGDLAVKYHSTAVPKALAAPLAFILTATVFLLALWQYKVLTSAKIKEMFPPKV